MDLPQNAGRPRLRSVTAEEQQPVSREGAWAQQAEADLPTHRHAEEIERGLQLGLEAAPSIVDRSISTFVRGELPHYAGETGTFLKCPFMEDVHDVHDAEVAIFGAPLDTGTTYRPGTRFGPQGIRRATNLFGTYSYELGVDLREQLNMVDIGDIFTIPGNLEKSFDQITRGMSQSRTLRPPIWCRSASVAGRRRARA